MIRKFVFTLVVCSGLLFAGAYYFKQQHPEMTRYVLGESDPEITLNDQALVTDDMVALGHVNHRILGKLDAQTLASSLEQIHHHGNGALKAVFPYLNVSDHQITYWTFSAYLSEETPLRSMAIAHGDFNTQILQRALQADYSLYSRYLGDVALYDLDLGDEVCDEGVTWSIYLSSDQVIVAESTLMDRLLSQIIARQHAGIALKDWSEFSRSKLMSFWLRRNEHLSKNSESSNVLTSFADEYVPGVDGLFLGVSFDILRQKGSFELQGNAKGERFASFAVAKWKSSLNRKKEALAVKLPNLYPFLSSIPMRSEQDRLNAQVDIEAEELFTLPGMFQEFADYYTLEAGFQDLGLLTSSSHRLEEKIDESPMPYFANITHKNLLPYDSIRMGEADVINGPFGLRVEKVSSDEEGALSLSFAVSGLARNIGNQGARAYFSVDELTDSAGNNLLSPSQCVKYKSLNAQSDHALNVMQSIALKAKSRYEHISVLKTHVVLNLPEKVKRQRVSLPKQYPHSFRINDSAVLTLHGLNGSRLSFSVSGRVIDLLEIRGLNAAGDILSQESFQQKASYSKPGVVDLAIGQVVFHGAPEGLELVIGEGEQLGRYSLILDAGDLKEKEIKDL